MLSTLFQMFALIGLGLIWSIYNPGQLESRVIRKVLTDTVYYLFLPALVLNILWQAPLGIDSVKISITAAIGVLAALLAAWLVCTRCRSNPQVTGAILLVTAFPNATYLGYPVLVKTLGEHAGSIAIQYDLFAVTPLLLTFGVILAAHYGEGNEKPNPLMLLIKVPPLWAALIATLLNVSGVPAPQWLSGLFSMMGSAVVPLMLLAIGLALKQGFREIHHLNTVIPVIVIKLALMPLLALGTTILLAMEGQLRTAVVLEAAMPSMVLGIVLCDRYGLNSGIYAAAVTATTVLSLFTLPLWFNLV